MTSGNQHPRATQHRLSRRTAIGTLAANATALALGSSIAPSDLLAQSGVTLGSSRADFDAALGAGTDLDGGLVQYGKATADAPAYIVRFSQDAAEFIEADFTGFDLGGREYEDAEIGESRFLPGDSQLRHSIGMGKSSLARSHYDLAIFTSESLAADTDRSGKILLVDEAAPSTSQNAGMMRIYPRANVSMESYDVLEIAPAGSSAQIGSSLADWETAHGIVEIGQTSLIIQDAAIGTILLTADDQDTVQYTDVTPATPLAMDDALAFITATLPADSVLEQTHWLSPTPGGPIGVRVQFYQTASLAEPVTLMIFIDGAEETGAVSRIIAGQPVAF